ncbi:hypothetical protein BTN82_21860 [Pseudomonas chlororaphis]|uniref:Uncharacterized protein n=2 Tax=Pseudomonas chlororaphis TaxID=587753 RepID=A0A1Q8EM50_9PSED|nr:hypothetical protein BTN82_21860 [Pseudomonas chlororaphis]
MNSALLLSNAIALAILVGFHFQPDRGVDQSFQYKAQHMQRQTAQWAVMSDTDSPVATPTTSDKGVVLPAAPRPESWVF